MPQEIIGAVAGITFLTIVNIIVVAYSYGRTSQKVADLCRRVSRLESIINRKGGQ